MTKQHYNKIIKYDFLNKFSYANISKIPKIKKITLTFKCKDISLQRLSIILFSMELITLKKGSFQIAKTSNVFLKIQKGVPCGGKVTINGTFLQVFLNRLVLDIIPIMKNAMEIQSKIITKNSFSYKFSSNSIVLSELQEQYPLFNDLPELIISFTTTANHSQN
jgi:ribosomal protein L5